MSGTILFVASNPTAIKFDFAGELTVIQEASSERQPSSLKLVSRWSVSANGLKSAVEAIRPEIVHLLSPGVDQVTNALVLADKKGRPEYAQPDAFDDSLPNRFFICRSVSRQRNLKSATRVATRGALRLDIRPDRTSPPVPQADS